MQGLRTWIEIDKGALRQNVGQILGLVSKNTILMAVVKSNAYGHGIIQIAKSLLDLRSFSERGWFGVDSMLEALALRREGVKNPILVLGSTLPVYFPQAAVQDIIVTISNPDSLRALARSKNRPVFHIKIDTGMHRQGFLPKDIFKLIKALKRFKLSTQGVYTHFASTKDIADPKYTFKQLDKFNSAVSNFKKAGFKNLILHAAASGGALLFPESHLNMVRVGMALYGYFPSPEAKLHLRDKIRLKPVLSWKTLITEIKEIPAGSYVGYDLTEKVNRKTRIAILPIGYWHGYDRGLSSIGEVLIGGKRAKVLGRVSMDMITVDITGIGGKSKFQNPNIKIGDEAVLVGRQGKQAIWADELAFKIGTSQYEFLTRVNPLIKRVAK